MSLTALQELAQTSEQYLVDPKEFQKNDRRAWVWLFLGMGCTAVAYFCMGDLMGQEDAPFLALPLEAWWAASTVGAGWGVGMCLHQSDRAAQHAAPKPETLQGILNKLSNMSKTHHSVFDELKILGQQNKHNLEFWIKVDAELNLLFSASSLETEEVAISGEMLQDTAPISARVKEFYL